ncbi:hypothetical protein G5V57_18745 [Nordella sp. HKS 07]|uniref:hypothetical protein n=1 Tax=Nordella sp. HKS 07 TaxID=2712222 RepID=UPI0013E1A975|nr:hypothetical protein [Nordella sp. HKS 07]QIG49571.1 hypothetical protein G5V57_18745 [Nordella sp. HKS 07]
MVGFIFGGNTGIHSPDELEQRRALARQAMAQSAGRVPQNVWEGLNSIAEAIGQRVERNRLDQAEATGRGAATDRFNALFGPKDAAPLGTPGVSGTAEVVSRTDGAPNLPPAGDAQPAGSAQTGGATLNELFQVYADPWTSPEQKSVLLMHIEREMRAANPERRP